MFYETQCVAAGVDSVAHRHKLVYVWETLTTHSHTFMTAHSHELHQLEE